MSDDTCDTCGRPLATDADEQVTAPGEGEDLCWRAYQGGVCMGEPVDWRQLFLAEAEARVAAEGACDCAESEVSRLREQVADLQAVETARSEGCACGDDEACRFVRERDEARAKVAQLQGLLRDMEYGHYPDGLASLCPACHLTPRMGHSVDCRLAAALEKDHG